MKRIMIVIILLLVLSVMATAQVKGNMYVESGAYLNSGVYDYNVIQAKDYGFNPTIEFVKFGAKIPIFKYLYIGGTVETLMNLSPDRLNPLSFFPFYAEYSFVAGLVIKNISIDYEHMCMHSVMPYKYHFQYALLDADKAYDRISVKYEIHF